MIAKIIITIIVYLSFAPLLIFSCSWLKNYIKARILRTNKNKKVETKKTLMGILKKHIQYTLKEDNTPKNKQIFICIYIGGLISSLLFNIINFIPLFILSLLIPYVAAITSYLSSKKILKDRDIVYDRMLSLKTEQIGLITGGRDKELNINQEFQILEWGENNITPHKVRLYLPTRFNPVSESTFLEAFSVVFGVNGRQWIADLSDEEHPGFDYNKGIATIRMTDSLPNIAMWHEKYLLNENIAWSFFPLAIGIENGVKITDPETGEPVHILGFDVSGDQVKLASKNNLEIGPEITMAPQIMIAGGTGGGKALSCDTKIQRIIDNKIPSYLLKNNIKTDITII